MAKRNGFSLLYERWQHESLTARRIKGYMIVGFPALLILIPLGILIVRLIEKI